MKRKKQLITAFNQRALNRAMLAVLGLCLTLIYLSGENYSNKDFKELLGLTDWILLGMGMMLQLVVMLIRAFMVRQSFSVALEDISFPEMLGLVFRKSFFNFFVLDSGFSRLCGSAKVLQKKDLSRAKIHASSDVYSIAESISIFIGFILSATFLIWNLVPEKGLLIGLSFLGAAIAGCYFLFDNFNKDKRLHHWAIRLVPQIPFLKSAFKRKEYDQKVFIQLIFLGVLAHIVQATLLAICLFSIEADLLLIPVLATYFIAAGFARLNLAFNGLGLFELVAILFLNYYYQSDTTGARVVLAVFIYRAISIGLPMTIGLIIMLLKNQRNFFISSIPAIVLFSSGCMSLAGWFFKMESHHRGISTFMQFIDSATLVLGCIQLSLSIMVMNSAKKTWGFAVIASLCSLAADYYMGLPHVFLYVSGVLTLILLGCFPLFPVYMDVQLRKIRLKRILIGSSGLLLYALAGYSLINPTLPLSSILNISFRTLLFDSVYIPNEPLSSYFLGFSLQLMLIAYVVILLSEIGIYNLFTLPKIKSNRKKASLIVEKNKSVAQHFYKLTQDKYFYLSQNGRSFISFSTAGEYAFILGNPVCRSGESEVGILTEFNKYCFNNCLKPIFVQIEDEKKNDFEMLGLRGILMGYDIQVRPDLFNENAESNQLLYNSFERIRHHQYVSKTYAPPLDKDFIVRAHQLNQVHYQELGKMETSFTEKPFSESGMKNQIVFGLFNHKLKMNAMASFVEQPGFARLDLLNKSKEAPHGSFDLLIASALDHGKKLDWKMVSLGFTPQKPVEHVKSFKEMALYFWYQNLLKSIPSKGLKETDTKFHAEKKPLWFFYDNDYDLIKMVSGFRKTLKGNQAFD